MKKNKSESELLTDQFNNELRSMNFHKVINYALTGYIYTKMFHKNENQKWDVDHVSEDQEEVVADKGDM